MKVETLLLKFIMLVYLGRGLKGGVDSDLWHVPVVDVLVAVPHTVDQVGLECKTYPNANKQNNP